jgi:hypothetical protein
MPTLIQIAYNIAEIKGRAEDLAFIQQTKFQVEYTRSLLFRRDFERTNIIPIQMLQQINGLEVIPVDAAEFSGVDVGCDIFRTKLQVPPPINIKGLNAFKYVGTIDWRRAYSYLDFNAVVYQKFNRYIKTPAAYYYREGHIYLTTNPKKITVSYVLDEPSKLEGFLDSNGKPLFSDEMDYPVSGDMLHRITQTILATEGSVNQAEDDHEVQVNE